MTRTRSQSFESGGRRGESGRYRFAVDTGGTFTDLIVADDSGDIEMFKAPTQPSDPIAGVLDVMRAAAQASRLSLAEYLARGDIFVHGTTHAINAIVTGRTARTAFLTTRGHPDTLVFREGGRQDAFNFTVPYPAPFVPKALTFEIPERVLSDGSVHEPLDENAAVATLERIAALHVEAIAVCLLWSVVNPIHEIAIGALIEGHLPGVPFTLSHHINPSIREYRRGMSTALDASLKPVMSAYMSGLESRMRDAGFAGRILVVTSQGGVMDAADVAAAPVHLINSGPSLAPFGAKAYAPADAAETLIVGDAGGTTFDVSVVRNGRIPRTRETWLGRPLVSHMTGMPSIDTRSIGAGGGSIAWVDEAGLLHVGPISAGAVPGPVCYGRGGSRPTVTDAAVVLGYIDPTHFLGGMMPLDRKAAEESIRREIARPAGQSLETAAASILELANEHMVQAILDVTLSQGIDPASAAFVAGGGAAGLSCVAIGRRLGCKTVYVPETGAALAAAGALISDLTSHHQAMRHTTSESFDFEGVNEVLDQLEARCRAFHASAGPEAELVAIDWIAEARYPDQAWEIEAPLRRPRFTSHEDVRRLVADFHGVHKDIFAVSDPHSPIEMIGWSATVRCRIGSPRAGRIVSRAAPGVSANRRVYFRRAGWTDADVHDFQALAPESIVKGPAIVESGFTSVVIDPGAFARKDQSGCLVIEVGA
ncbi:MAG TPA: hydantoinase/oxoprolinase family protein [Roseiarcus sp.]|nr:hydantoinase/oxoprolinase family protein [Roseiarcus sp.]